MPETVLGSLRRHLDAELQSPDVAQLPSDFYSAISSYSKKLRRSSGSGNSEAAQRLISVQVKMVESMTRDLLEARARKAREQRSYARLLPEERYVCSPGEKYRRRLSEMVGAVSGGQPAYVEFARKAEAERAVVVRFTQRVEELIGFDLRRYGPFEAEDVASIPAASAEVLISGGAAVELNPRESD